MLIVGGSASIATVVLRHTRDVLASVISGTMIIGFEIVEVLVVGSQPGLMRALQIFYVTLGLVIVGLAGWLWATGRAAGSHARDVHTS